MEKKVVSCKEVVVAPELFDVAVNDFNVKKFIRYRWFFVVTKLVCKWNRL